MAQDKIVAVGFLTRGDLNMLGAGFRRHFAIEDAGDFADLIERLDGLDVVGDDELVDPTERDMQRKAQDNANPLAPPITLLAGS